MRLWHASDESDDSLLRDVEGGLSRREAGSAVARRLMLPTLILGACVLVFRNSVAWFLLFGAGLGALMVRVGVHLISTVSGEFRLDAAVRELRSRGRGHLLIGQALAPLDGSGLQPRIVMATAVEGILAVAIFAWVAVLLTQEDVSGTAIWHVGASILGAMFIGAFWLASLLLRAFRLHKDD